jgi:hypothetical protein
MIGLTPLQTLKKQNRELRIRLENRQGKAELALCAMEEEMAALKAGNLEKDGIIAMLQREIHALAQELEKARDLRTETMRGRIDEAVADAAAPLLEAIAKANAEISRLKSIINKDSSNSSKPPRTDGFKRTLSNRDPSGRPRGGQPGHPGHRLGLPENLDELVEKGIAERRVVDHTDGSGEYISRYVIDIEVLTTVTEHRFAVGGKLPEEFFNEVTYGDNIKAMSVLLLNEGIIAELRLSEIIEDLTRGAITISPATLEKFQSRFAQKLESGGELEAIKEDLLNREVMHTDDTPLRCAEIVEYLDDGTQIVRVAENASFNATIRTYSNETSTLYTVNPKKDKAGVDRDGILPNFFGILSHDHESKFYNYGTLHATCGEHLERDLKGLRDLQLIPWAGDMRALILKMNRHKNLDLEKNIGACDPEALAGFEKEYDDLMARGRAEFGQMKEDDFGSDEFRKMLNRLTDYKDSYLLFIRNYKAPFTNNLGERDLRPEKTKEKVSILFRTWNGIKAHTKIRSFISTLKKRKYDLFSSIVHVNDGIPVLR